MAYETLYEQYSWAIYHHHHHHSVKNLSVYQFYWGCTENRETADTLSTDATIRNL